MRNSPVVSFLSIAVLFVLIGIPVYDVVTRQVTIVSLVAYISGIITVWHLLHPLALKKIAIHQIWIQDILIISILSILTVIPLLYFSSNPSHYHQDEFITAYTSWSLPDIRNIDWFAAYPQTWVSQFPVLFHVLQKPWFFFLGTTVLAVRLSVLPYAAGTVIALYLFTRLTHSRGAAILIGILYIFFAPRMYLESMGLHFISSVFFFTSSLACWLLFVKKKHDPFALGAGLFAALGFLTYTSSYAALPVVLTSGVVLWMANRDPRYVRGIRNAGIIFAVILLPFVTYALFVNNFFLQRIGQINAVSGSWNKSAYPQNPLTMLATQTETAMKSLVRPGIGGTGGYNFGQLSFLDPISAILVIGGLAVCVLRIVRSRSPAHVILLIGILIPFINGFILTIHPPPFHRISLLYPLIAFLMGDAIIFLWKLLEDKRIALIVCIGVVVAYTPIQFSRTARMIRNDGVRYPQNSRALAAFLLKSYPPGATVRVAAYPAFYLEQELLFRTNNRFAIHTGTIEDILPQYSGEPLIVLEPTASLLATLAARYPTGSWTREISGIDLGDLALFTTE